MATSITINDLHGALSNLDLWYKLNSNDDIMLTDVPEFISLRWTYFRDRWLHIKDQLMRSALSTAEDPDFLKSQIDDFTAFIESQRNSNKNLNPLSDAKLVNKFYQVFNSIKIGEIELTNEEQRILQVRTQTISNYSKNDFLNIKNIIKEYRDSLTDIVGLGDDDYNMTNRRSSVPSQRTASTTDINLLATLENSISSIDYILANLFAIDAFVDPFTVARTNANNPDINIGQYSSGKLVKLEHGQSLESLATVYLGDPDKWIDIAIANGLKPPYIDEIGEKIFFLANGNGNQINIASLNTQGEANSLKFFINQAIYIQSDLYPYPSQRIISNIAIIPVSGEILLEVDGEADLNLYKTVENASIRVYKQNTISSSQFILIPSTDPLVNNRKDEIPWFLAKSQEDEKQAKIDLELSDNGDFNITPTGDISLSYGIQNAIQALKIKMAVEVGTLVRHPNFGLVNVTGSSTNDIGRIKSLVSTSIRQQIGADTRFSRLENLSVNFVNTSKEVGIDNSKTPNVAAISMSVRLAGSDTNIPISFTVNY